jgi:hypothetical protein
MHNCGNCGVNLVAAVVIATLFRGMIGPDVAVWEHLGNSSIGPYLHCPLGHLIWAKDKFMTVVPRLMFAQKATGA